MEATDCSAEYIILNIFEDDHVRNLDAARWIRTAWSSQFNPNSTTPLHGLPWAHVRFDLDEGRFVDRPGLCPDDAALRDLCDPEHFYETFKDDVIVRLFTLMIGGEAELADLEALAEALGVHVDLRDPDKRKDDARRLHRAYGLKSTEYILDNMRAWIEEAGKKLMVHLSYGEGSVRNILAGGERFDRPFMDYLERNGIVYVDAGRKHLDDYNRRGLPIEDYANPFFVHPKVAAVFGHYSPAGNHFYAFSVKDEVVDWLDPKPPAYRQ